MTLRRISHRRATQTIDFFVEVIRSERLPVPVKEHRFGAIEAGGIGKGVKARLKEAGLKDWRFDYAWPEQKLALEVEGGVFTGGRHTSAMGFLGDMRKYNAATLKGWRVLRCQPKELCRTETINMIREALQTTTAA